MEIQQDEKDIKRMCKSVCTTGKKDSGDEKKHGDAWWQDMLRGIQSPEDAVQRLMAVSNLAENMAFEISAELALLARERIYRITSSCTTCTGVCLCGLPPGVSPHAGGASS